MQNIETWTRTHDLALIFIALAYGTDHVLSEQEMQSMTQALSRWKLADNTADVQEIVMEAMAVYLEADGVIETTRSMHALLDALSLEERRQALEDVVRVAESDGILLFREQELITILANVWDVKELGDDLLDTTSVELEPGQRWTILHDLALVFLAVAHGSDNKLEQPEISAMVERLGEWAPNLEEDEVRQVLREALQRYSEGPERANLTRTIDRLGSSLEVSQRLAALNDLAHIAAQSGGTLANAQEMIGGLAKSWQVEIRL